MVFFRGGGIWPPLPHKIVGLNFVDRLIYVSIAYIPNLGPLGPLLHVEKFVVVVVVVVVCKAILVIILDP